MTIMSRFPFFRRRWFYWALIAKLTVSLIVALTLLQPLLSTRARAATATVQTLRGFVDQLKCGKLRAYGAMTVVPILSRDAHNSGLTALSQAVTAGQAHVGDNSIDNSSSATIFCMAGIPLERAGRTCLQHDLLLGPQSGKHSVPVYTLWATQPELPGTRRTFLHMPNEVSDMHGAILLVNDGLVTADAFAERRLFQAQWPSLLDYYLQQAALHAAGPLPTHNISAQLANELLGRARTAEAQAVPGRDLATVFRLNGPGLNGEALVYADQTVHLRVSVRDER
jgi:hypothetical protein